MSASNQQAPTPAPHGDMVTASGDDKPERALRKSLLVGSLLIATAAGCNGTGKSVGIEPPPTSTTTQAASATPTPSVRDQILTQYRAFWANLTPISRMPAAARRAALASYVVDPELKSLVAGMAKIDAEGKVYYGADVPSALQASVSPDGTTAVVNDCQDSRNSGLARRSDMAPLTKGVARNHVVVTMKQSADVWKVYFVSYSKTPC